MSYLSSLKLTRYLRKIMQMHSSYSKIGVKLLHNNRILSMIVLVVCVVYRPPSHISNKSVTLMGSLSMYLSALTLIRNSLSHFYLKSLIIAE